MATSIPNHLASRQALAGLSEREAERRLAQAGKPDRRRTSRSYLSIVRANVFTVFNAILAAFGVITLLFGDWRDALFLGIIVVNSGIGIFQETRAKRALDRLALLVAPKARVIRDGVQREAPVEDVVLGDLLALRAGDQVVADGTLAKANELRLDESILTGESESVSRSAGEEVRSGSFAVEGSATYVVDAVGENSFAAKIVGEARSFRHPRSPLERAVNRLLYGLVGLVLFLGGLLGWSLYHRHVPLHEAVSTSSAGVVSLVPEGLIVLVSLTYAAAAVRMSRRGVLAQQLNAIESLASVEVICVDKTGTLTESSLRVAALVPAATVSEQDLRTALAKLAASASARNMTMEAIAEMSAAGASTAGASTAETTTTEPEAAIAEVPFSSRRRWSAVELQDGVYVLGAPERFALGMLSAEAEERQREGRRVLALGHVRGTLGEDVEDQLPMRSAPLGLVVLAERLRPNIEDTVAFLLSQGVELKVLSGDAPQTVAAIARDVGIPVSGVYSGAQLTEKPDGRGDEASLLEIASSATVIGRISPEGKRAVVKALHDSGRYVAMLGDGVNDVPALKSSRLAIAQGSGTQMARSVSDLVLIDGDFAAVPALVHEGRRALRNLQRVAKLYVTKSAFAAFLILTIGLSSDAYPLLPRHLTLTAAITIGIPTFFLALAPSTGPWRPERFVRRVARFAVPAGTIAGTGLIAGYLFAVHDLGYSIMRSRTVATTVLVAVGLYLVLTLEAAGSKRRSALVGTMCAGLAGLYALALLLPITREFFKLAPPSVGPIAIGLAAAAIAIGALALSGYSPIPSGEREDEEPRPME